MVTGFMTVLSAYDLKEWQNLIVDMDKKERRVLLALF